MRRSIEGELAVALGALIAIVFGVIFVALLSANPSNSANTLAGSDLVDSNDEDATVISSRVISVTKNALHIPTIIKTFVNEEASHIQETLSSPSPSLDAALVMSATETLTSTSTTTPGASKTPILTPTSTATPTFTLTASETPETATVRATSTKKPTLTSTFTATATTTATATATVTFTLTSSPTSTKTATATATKTPTITPSATRRPSSTPTATPTTTDTLTPTATATLTVIPVDMSICVVPNGWLTYRVQYGDTLFSIAQSVGLPLLDLQTANCIINPNQIIVGQIISVPRLPNLIPNPIPVASPGGGNGNGNFNPPSGPIGCRPEVRITSPIAFSTIQGAITVYGTANTDTFWYYKLEIRPDQPAAYNFLFRGDASKSQTILGTFNTAGLPSGQYYLRLSVVDISGGIQANDICEIPVRIP